MRNVQLGEYAGSRYLNALYLTNSQVGVVNEYLNPVIVLYLWIYLLNEPLRQLLVTLDGCTVVAEQVYAEAFKMLLGGLDVVQYPLFAVALGTAEQAYALEVLCHIAGCHAVGYSF